MKNLFTLSFLLFITFNLAAQQVKRIYIDRSSTVNVSQVIVDWQPTLYNLEIPKPGTDTEEGRLLLLKQKIEQKYAHKKKSGYHAEEDKAPSPIVRDGFEALWTSGIIPNDNDIAVSRDGYILSVLNSHLSIYKTGVDTLIHSLSLNAFSDTLASGSKFDPRAMYDPIEDRFVMVYLNGSLDSTSRVVVAFSQTNDPTQGWNIYSLPGNPLDNKTWSDFPAISLSDRELFIAMNTFLNGSQNNHGYIESTIWQIGKAEGYLGQTLETNYHHDLNYEGDTIFNFCPVKGGASLPGPEMYFISNENRAEQSDTIYLLTIPDYLTSNPSPKIELLRTPVQYGMPPNARQQGNFTLETNDSRTLGAFIENNTIQFVQCSIDTTTGNPAIFHGIIKDPVVAKEVSGHIIGDSVLHMGFPSISYTGLDKGEQEAIISFDHCAPSVKPGMSAIYYSNDGKYSDIITLKEGDARIYLNQFQKHHRWGDYTGSQPDYSDRGKVWISGTYGRSNHQEGTWVSRLASPDSIRIPDAIEGGIKVFPNPGTFDERITVEFDISQTTFITAELVDLHGNRIKLLLEGKAKPGRNVFGFNQKPLAQGVYFLLIREGKEIILEHKLVVN